MELDDAGKARTLAASRQRSPDPIIDSKMDIETDETDFLKANLNLISLKLPFSIDIGKRNFQSS
jgi:hypothetical protein